MPYYRGRSVNGFWYAKAKDPADALTRYCAQLSIFDPGWGGTGLEGSPLLKFDIEGLAEEERELVEIAQKDWDKVTDSEKGKSVGMYLDPENFVRMVKHVKRVSPTVFYKALNRAIRQNQPLDLNSEAFILHSQYDAEELKYGGDIRLPKEARKYVPLVGRNKPFRPRVGRRIMDYSAITKLRKKGDIIGPSHYTTKGLRTIGDEVSSEDIDIYMDGPTPLGWDSEERK